MFLKKAQRRSDGRMYLSCVHGFWDSEAKCSRTRTVKSFGYVDELIKDYPDPISHFQKVVDEMEEKRQAEEGSIEVSIDPKTILTEGSYRKNFGFAALSTLFHELELNYFFDNRREKIAGRYNLGSIVKLLVYGRILTPASKRATHAGRKGYFETFDFSLDSIYKGLGELARLSKDIQLFLHRRISKLYGRMSEIVYYDVTNYYFESDAVSDFRAKGHSKEYRPDPIVQMGLLIDSAGLPITFDLFRGNTLDCETLLPVLSRIKRDFGFERIVVVADKGLNTSDNVAYNTIKGDGYLFSKSVRKANEELREWTLKRKGYQKTSAETFTKSRMRQREISVSRPDGKKVKVPIEEKQVAVWSRKYALRQRQKRECDIKKAQELIDSAGKYSKATHKGAARLVKGFDVDEKTGEVLASKQMRALDTERIKNEERLDGFYILTTSEVDKSSRELISLYSGLWKIEDSFRVTKSELQARPVFLSLDDHIAAHFLVCYIALILIRILEAKTEGKHSVSTLTEAMREASASYLESNVWLFNYRSKVLDDIGSALNIDFSRKYMRVEEIRKTIGATKKKVADTQ
jgi:transposase